MIRKLIICQALLGIGLGSIYLLPRGYKIRESAIIMILPNTVDEWFGESMETSEVVINALADDTNYAQSQYKRRTPGTEDKIDITSAFVVLSGDDMNNSIHRPERCLAAQGFEILSSEEILIPINEKYNVPTRRLLSKHLRTGVKQISYYWFTGAKKITASHYNRTFTDIFDRLTTGTNQRWAFVNITSPIIEDRNAHPFAVHSIEETDQLISDFISNIFILIHNEDQLGADWTQSRS
ncbi:MAG: EpsI family protein [Verrucomicrobiota bacterium]|jgi:EpsI family protein|nr:EpsI family protein [Verrucomicrobiota bacterium]MED5470809.1 EpsI family protein [Verrucomicrobiota bacterium]MEE2967952.1 EpsI family protein [Verrucomicrobiota bacterium]|tara:strand:+ start:318 stop:1031 length:714 start_codon:yes stop_codon:yes gene_type:complete